MKKNFILAVINIAAAVFFLYYKLPVWIAFSIFSFYYSTQLFKRKFPKAGRQLKNITYGILDNYDVDGDVCYGLFIRISDADVFVDIKKDGLLEERKTHAIYLYKNQNNLEISYRSFLEKNKKYIGRKINSIGLHSKNIKQGEVFWDSEGYTLLQDLIFTAD